MVAEEKQEQRLKEYNILIKTILKDQETIKYRYSDHSKEDNIENGIIIGKEYWKENTLLKKESIFDSRITYSYEWNKEERMTCKNCGNTGKKEEFMTGCPYCHTSYNMEYQKKELGSKHYYDLVVKKRSYQITTYLIAFLISSLLVSIYIINTSRTLYAFDLLKIGVGTVLISLLCYLPFYYLDAMILLPGIKRKKEKENEKQEAFFKEMNWQEQEKNKFFNNIQSALRTYYYGEQEKEVIDFDMIDYTDYKVVSKTPLRVEVTMDIRFIRYDKEKITSKTEKNTYCFRYQASAKELKPGENELTCPSCGGSIKIAEEKCSYCGTKAPNYAVWVLEKRG